MYDAIRHVSQVNADRADEQDVRDHLMLMEGFRRSVQELRRHTAVQCSCFPWDLTIGLADLEAWAVVHEEELRQALKGGRRRE